MNTEFSTPFNLGRAERLQVVEDLWDSIAAEYATLPVADWKRVELRKRKEHYLAHPESGRNWGDVKKQARPQHD